MGTCATYLYFATGTVYADKGVRRLVKVVALTSAAGGMVLGYRFAVFLITLYSV